MPTDLASLRRGRDCSRKTPWQLAVFSSPGAALVNIRKRPSKLITIILQSIFDTNFYPPKDFEISVASGLKRYRLFVGLFVSIKPI